jgi:hypothetical protein
MVWWFQADADIFSLRSAASQLNGEERRLHTAALGLSGGIFLTSDLPSQWSEEDVRFLRQFWNAHGPVVSESQYIAWTPEGEIIAYRITVPAASRKIHRVALFNWADRPRILKVSLHQMNLVAGLRLTRTARVDGYRLNNDVIRVIDPGRRGLLNPISCQTFQMAMFLYRPSWWQLGLPAHSMFAC